MTEQAANKAKPLLDCLRGNQTDKIPFWLMRQAGRYLPEYQEIRKKAGGFLEMCLTPDLACTVTLQPIERFGFDAAILFSDILIVPYALGQSLRFDEGIGPILEPIRDEKAINALKHKDFIAKIAPVLETIHLLKKSLPANKTLIGFAGAPWTVTAYMIEGKTSRDFINGKKLAFAEPEQFQKLLDIITDHTILYLSEQIKAGADCIQIFDSWAGMLDEQSFYKYVIKPTQKIIDTLKSQFPECPIICFPRQAGLMLEIYSQSCAADAISLDSSVPLNTAQKIQKNKIVQGNLDPVWLLEGGKGMENTLIRLLDKLGKDRYIFNLGHGILPQTPTDHVKKLCDIIQNYQKTS